MSSYGRKRKYNGTGLGRLRRKIRRITATSYTRYPRRRRNIRRRFRKNMSRGNYYKKGGTVMWRPRRFKGLPIVRGTSHHQEFYGVGYSSTVLGNNPIFGVCQAFSANTLFDDNWDAITLQTYVNHDAYKEDFPTGYRKIFWRGLKLRIRVTNTTETAVTVRICFATPKANKTAADWNTDPNRAINCRHWRVRKLDKFIMTASDYVDVAGVPVAQKTSTLVREYWIPQNRWLATRDGDPSDAENDFQAPYSDRQMFFFIDTDDATAADTQFLTFQVNATQYWYTADSNET